MNIFLWIVALWIVASLLAAAFLLVGAMKLSRTNEQLAASGLGWTQDFTAGTVKAIGALEVLAALGLILPALFGVAPTLVPLAALGLALLMVGAAITHGRRREFQMILVNATLLARRSARSASAPTAPARAGPPLRGHRARP